MFDEDKHPRDGDGKFTDGRGEGSREEYRQSVNDRIKWAKENGVELPLNTDGSVDDLKLQELFEEKKASDIKASQLRMGDYVERFRDGDEVESEIEVAKVEERERKEIEKLTGDKLTATSHVLNVDELRHIENRHGENGAQDHSMSNVDNYKNIADVLHNFDKIDFCRDKKGAIQYSAKYRGKDNKPAVMLTYTKKYSNHIHMVVETVCESKSGKLHIISSYTKYIEN